MKALENLMFTKMQASRGFKLFGERAVVAMVGDLKKLDEGAIPGKKVIEAINTNVLSSSDK